MSETLNRYRALIRKELQNQIAQIPQSLSSYFYYHFGWENARGKFSGRSSGKMVRPLLCLLSCKACGGKISQSLPAACAIELIHNFSLIHDDIEDASLERHHRLTLWKAFGLAPAINAGDAMFTLGYRALLKPLSTKSTSKEHKLEALKILAEACLKLCEGQDLDLSLGKKREIGSEEYYYMIKCKTAALFQASTHIGALLGGATDSQIKHIKEFGLKLGMAFQIQDDILGIWGEEEKIGKPVSDDILNRKKTIPVIYALQKEKERGLKKLKDIYSSEKISLKQLPAVTGLLNKYKAKEFCLSQVNLFYRKSLASLKATSLSANFLKELENLSNICVGRDN